MLPRVRPADLALAAGAAFLAGGVNAVAGGGSLISFPALLAVGVPPVAANITNTVALCPGYLGGAVAQRGALAGQRRRLPRLLVAGGLGGLTGAVLLVATSDTVFRQLIPWLLLAATSLLAFQDRIRAWLRIGTPEPGAAPPADPLWLVVPVFVVSVYGGYFGAGLSIMLLAVLGVVLHEPLNRLNALKQVLSLVINVVAAVFFAFSGKVHWDFAAVMALGSLAGGAAGGRVADRMQPRILRVVVVTIGVAAAVVYFLRSL